jgi:hypothetical protein
MGREVARKLVSCTRAALASGLILAVGLGLAAARRLPPPTPSAGFYRLEVLSGDQEGQVVAFCFTPGHGGQVFGEGHPPRAGRACSAPTVTRIGDGWDARQQCTEEAGFVGTHAAQARRQPGGDLIVTLTIRPRSSRQRLPRSQIIQLHRVGPRCPAPLRPGEFVVLTEESPGGWSVQQIGDPIGRGRSLSSLPPAIAAVRQP